MTDEIERGNAVVIAGDSFAVDNAGARAQASRRLEDEREATSEVVAGTTVEPHLRAVLARNDAKTVVLDLMQPMAAGRQLVGFGWEARRDEPGREGYAATYRLNKSCAVMGVNTLSTDATGGALQSVRVASPGQSLAAVGRRLAADRTAPGDYADGDLNGAVEARRLLEAASQ